MGNTLDELRKAEAEADQMLNDFESEIEANKNAATPIEDIGLEGKPVEEVKKPTETPPVEPAVPAPKQAVEPQPLSTPEPKYDQMYKTLKGKYDAEVPRLHKKVSELAKQVEESKEASAKVAPAEMTPDAAKELLKDTLSEEEISAMGDDALVLYAKIASGVSRRIGDETTKRLEQELNDLKSQMANNHVADVWDDVEREVPGARDINANDPGWVEFLNGTESMSGLSYHEIGERAVTRGDSAVLASLMKVYQGDNGAHKDIVTTEPVVKPSQAASSASSSVSTTDSEQVLIKESDIPAFYNAVRRGEYAGKEDLMKAREAEIDAAVQESRVIPG